MLLGIGETGLQKRIEIDKNNFKNLNPDHEKSRKCIPTAFCWENDDEFLVVQRDGNVSRTRIESNEKMTIETISQLELVSIDEEKPIQYIENSIDLELTKVYGKHIILLDVLPSGYFTCDIDRNIRYYNSKFELISSKDDLSIYNEKIIVKELTSTIVNHRLIGKYNRINKVLATGGFEFEIELFQLNENNNQFSSTPFWRSRNVSHDHLSLRIPIWIRDIVFYPQLSQNSLFKNEKHSNDLIVCTAYGHVRYYSPKTSKRQPLWKFDYEGTALSHIRFLPNSNNLFVCSTTNNDLLLFDMNQRQKNEKGLLIRGYRGHAGLIEDIQFLYGTKREIILGKKPLKRSILTTSTDDSREKIRYSSKKIMRQSDELIEINLSDLSDDEKEEENKIKIIADENDDDVKKQLFIVTGSLDRYIRIYEIDDSFPLKQIYVKSRMKFLGTTINR
ncbi:hypothetical protein SNEBB_001842 [Seison nebaliae]|nr:hypothetical protein SNEBB_001842 [Seison nebaliae]